MQIDLTQIVVGIVGIVISIVGALITRYVIPWIRSRTTAAQQDMIYYWVQTFVLAAEQTFTGDGRGAEKLAYVLGELEKKNLKVDAETLRALIEAIVFELKNKG